MARRRYLIAYDIADPKRLRRVISLMEGVGERLQYSVFLCDLSARERIEWEAEMRTVMKMSQDSVVVVDMGAIGAMPVVCLGVPRRFPNGSGATIV